MVDGDGYCGMAWRGVRVGLDGMGGKGASRGCSVEMEVVAING